MMSNPQHECDVILIGAGIMSATLGTFLKELAPNWTINVFEKLQDAGEESSNEWNNAGTGHAALCELNYTPESKDGQIDISKAVKINEQFQLSKEFWSHLVQKQYIKNPQDFIMPLPHMSFVEGEENVTFLKNRYEALKNHHFFEGMEFSSDHEKLAEWIPLMMKDRKKEEIVAATKIDIGTDVNFGNLTRLLFDHLQQQEVTVRYQHMVKDVKREKDGMWRVKVKDLTSGETTIYRSKFVFLGAGGASLPLLQKSRIPEGKGVGGFPVSGLFLVCQNENIVNQHHAKVYGKAKVGAPPMSVPHLDTRYIDGKKSLLFGPFAGFSPKFLKTGSNLDLLASVKPNNVVNMLAAGAKNLGLTKYLIEQVLLSKEKRVEELREFIPNAKAEDWDTVIAGQRVQIIEETEAGGKGTLQFGTKVVTAEDGSIAGLLGASPGASTAVSAMLDVLEQCFPDQMRTWETKLKEMIPSYGVSLSENAELFHQSQSISTDILRIQK